MLLIKYLVCCDLCFPDFVLSCRGYKFGFCSKLPLVSIFRDHAFGITFPEMEAQKGFFLISFINVVV